MMAMEWELDDELASVTTSPEKLPTEMEVFISHGVTEGSITDAVNSIKRQMKYDWQSLYEEKEDVPSVKIDVLKKKKESILIRISKEPMTKKLSAH